VGILATSGCVLGASTLKLDQDTIIRPARVQSLPGSFLGVELSDVTSDTVQRLKLRGQRGALIDGVTSGSSAAQAGLQKDDVIVKWDGQPIESASELSRHIRETPAGRDVRLGVMRGGQEIEINVKLGDRAALVDRLRVARPIARVRVRPEIPVTPRAVSRAHLGVELQSMTPQLAEYFGLSKRSGALVVFVFADSPAAKAGLKAGDVILNVGGENVENPSDLRRVLDSKSEGSVEFRVLRDKREQTLKVLVDKGTNSWLLEPDDYREAVRVAIAPMVVQVPKFSIAPMVVKVPKFSIAPMVVTVPKFSIAPSVMALPRIKVTPMMVEMPKIKVAPLALPSLKINVPPVKVDVPKIKISPVNVVVVPRRVVL
jgi:serine protease Do